MTDVCEYSIIDNLAERTLPDTCTYCGGCGEAELEQELENGQVIDYAMPCPQCNSL
jgi:hypothetical protein